MSEKTKTLSIEGDTYVIPGEDPYNPADVTYARDEGADWNNFQPMTPNDAEYVSKPDAPETVEFRWLKDDLDQKIGVGAMGAMSLGKVA